VTVAAAMSSRPPRGQTADMSDIVVLPSGGGDIVGDSTDRRVEIVSDDETLHATWSRFGPGREGAELHVHRRHTDVFYVLDGELTIALGSEGEPVRVPAGTLARVPPLVVHGFRNASEADVRYLNLHAPGQRFADYLRAVREGRPFSYDQHPPPPDGGRPPAEAVVGGAEILDDGPGRGAALLADVEDIGIAEVWSEAGDASPPVHVHRAHVESLYVLEGAITFRTASGELRAEAGTWVQVPPGVPHSVTSADSRTVRFLDVHTPSCRFGTFLRRLHEAPRRDETAAARAAEFDQVPA
jgi:mannose-6-phosphate isomerase-like protein (cupin superfamily)